jgi:hypothetical protein
MAGMATPAATAAEGACIANEYQPGQKNQRHHDPRLTHDQEPPIMGVL